MGTAESSQSSEMGVIAGLTNQSAFHQQSPNVARLIRSETSSKMEYEFPITDVPPTSPSHHHHGGGGGGGGTVNHSLNHTRLDQTYSHPTSTLTSPQLISHNSQLLANTDNMTHPKIHSNQTSSLWITLTSCFGCRTRNSNDASTNSLRDKVHAIRIVRASNDLTPAVFDSHYNIITLEQLRECDNNGGSTVSSLPNDLSDPLPSQNSDANSSNQNGNGSVTAASSAAAKKNSNTRLKKKKKKRTVQSTYASQGINSDDDDDRSGRTINVELPNLNRLDTKGTILMQHVCKLYCWELIDSKCLRYYQRMIINVIKDFVNISDIGVSFYCYLDLSRSRLDNTGSKLFQIKSKPCTFNDAEQSYRLPDKNTNYEFT
ncbi:unnamed protein product [Adineta ricciae]|uniref:Uncharacterized protein n=1 Tax=Adineta ricciae TaxID=249248 RepID=A0A813R139_ADIRI|nr:unnamed protein product [Adineta ricciae]